MSICGFNEGPCPIGVNCFIDSLPIGAAVMDVEGKILVANYSLSQFTDYSISELCGMRWTQLVDPMSLDEHLKAHKQLVDGPFSRSVVLVEQVIAKPKIVIWVRVTAWKFELDNQSTILTFVEEIDSPFRGQIDLSAVWLQAWGWCMTNAKFVIGLLAIVGGFVVQTVLDYSSIRARVRDMSEEIRTMRLELKEAYRANPPAVKEQTPAEKASPPATKADH